MSERTLWLLQVVFQTLAGIFAVGVAATSAWSVTLDERYEGVRLWFKKVWTFIDSSRWLQLSDRLLRGLLDTLQLLSIKFSPGSETRGLYIVLTRPHIVAAIMAVMVRGTAPIEASYWLRFGPPLLVLAYGIGERLYTIRVRARHRAVALAVAGGRHTATTAGTDAPASRWQRAGSLLFPVDGDTVLLMYAVVASSFGILRCLSLPLERATPEALFMMPGLWLVTWVWILGGLLLLHRRKGPLDPSIVARSFGQASTAALTVPLSIGFMFIGFSIGHYLAPEAVIPQTAQMLGANIFFDALTVALSYAVLRRMITHRLRVPLVCGIIVTIAGVLACCSLYLGLVGTPDALSVREVLRVLVGRHPTLPRWEPGPEFWVMHTTFLPLLVVLAAIFAAWVAKLLMLPARWFFGKGQASKNPLALTSVYLGVLAAVFTAISGLLRIFAARPG
jgi:hypothetical protein